MNYLKYCATNGFLDFIGRAVFPKTPQTFLNAELAVHKCSIKKKFFLKHCVKSVRIRSYSRPYLSAFGLNMDQNNSKYGHFSSSEKLGKIHRKISVSEYLFNKVLNKIVY